MIMYKIAIDGPAGAGKSIDDLLKKSDEELYFNRVLLEKNKKFVCGKEN